MTCSDCDGKGTYQGFNTLPQVCESCGGNGGRPLTTAKLLDGLRHAWYSEKQAVRCGTVFYTRENGERVEVTVVTQSDDSGCGWDDMEYRGVVKNWVATGRQGTGMFEQHIQKMKKLYGI